MEPMKPLAPMEPMQPMQPMKPMTPMTPMTPIEAWWPKNLGEPDSAGSQNDLRYAYFASAHRLAVQRDGKTAVYDTADHQIGGVAQQQSGRDGDATFTSQHGNVSLKDLKQA